MVTTNTSTPDITLRRRTGNSDAISAIPSSTITTASAGNEETGASTATSTTRGATTPSASAIDETISASTQQDERPIYEGKVYYNGQLYEGTGRLPRDAPFTPSYINTYTVNSAIAFVSLVVTITFFYFKIVVGLLESPQVGPDREFLASMAMDHHGPIDGSEPRSILEPICPSPEQLLELQRQRNGSGSQGGGVGGNDCVLFGKIVVLADSISKYGYTHATHGWLGFLADEWAGRADVVLRGFPEYNTHWVKSIFPEILHQESPSVVLGGNNGASVDTPGAIKLVVIALGTDDASFPNTRHHVSLSAYKENLRTLIKTIRFPDSPNYSPDTQIILVTPAPVDTEMWAASLAAINLPLDRSNNVTQQYAHACVEVGEELHVPVVDLWSDIDCQIQRTCDLHESNRLSDFLMDGLHLKRLGNEVLYKGVLNTVAHHYPHLHPKCWPSVYPGYTESSSPNEYALKRPCVSRH
ncbi:hypothetical protein BG015_005158 [Linnemannia schmuckeri]|uniref:SGNH hydrolase-type esterase domain-containing protein n=1 Tax=Linnemannia schmuckeri TaxID=64567 RepID=A0A9P5UXP2_9FUNG|nr:hypothetical protein BG015_005158 [Linnemannia schmuckeri]